jgi:hypothetical protein
VLPLFLEIRRGAFNRKSNLVEAKEITEKPTRLDQPEIDVHS